MTAHEKLKLVDDLLQIQKRILKELVLYRPPYWCSVCGCTVIWTDPGCPGCRAKLTLF